MLQLFSTAVACCCSLPERGLPVPRIVEAVLCQELRDSIVEIRIKLVDDALVLHN